jgi:tRNA(fMet)-specific endonuclease VapC
MVSHVLDTDMLSLFQHGHANVCRRCASAPPNSLAITTISVEEQFLGWYTRIRQAKTDAEIARAYDGMTAFATFIKGLPILSFPLSAIQRYRQLKAQKIKAGKKDLCVAAIALEHSAIVATGNSADFGLVPGLSIEDWPK